MFSRSRQLLDARSLAIAAIAAVASASQGCSCASSVEDAPPGCGSDCAQECKEDLPLGVPGAYTSLAKAADGTLWVSGYNDSLVSEGDRELWGDLVVGRYDAAKDRVVWETVDGLPERPEGTCADRAANSWRRGESDSGDNVGLYTSAQVSPDGHPMVSYYDVTHHRLKFAVESDGWKVFTVKEQAGADVGRFSKMVLVDGKPVIAFLQFAPGSGGKTRSSIVVARANVAVPTKAEDFRFGEVAIEEDNPCSPTTCASGEACVQATGACSPKVGGCTPADCGQDKACVTEAGKATCVAVKVAAQTYPDLFGDFIALARGPKLGIVVYDRPRGNLVGLAEQGDGTWTRMILDGEKGSRADKTAVDTGDVGLAPSLQIDSDGTWHVSYVSALDETLRYVTVAAGKVSDSVIVDDGTSVDGSPITAGKHLVGDDSVIRVEGESVTIYYQDVTVGTLRRAFGSKRGAWELTTIPQPGKFGGYFPQLVPGDDRVANFWEQTVRDGKRRVGDVSILSP